MRASLTLVLALLFLATGPIALGADEEPRSDPDISLTQSGSTDAQPFVYNGDATPNPGWIASILDSGFYTCSGSLIHESWVLTAGHCVVNADSAYRVRVGADLWYSGVERRIAAVLLHPGYRATLDDSVDIALVQLDSPVTGKALPVLARSASWPSLNQPLVVAGWGETYDNSPIPDLLQAAGVWVDSDSSGNVNEPYCPREWVAESGYDDFCFGGFSWACRGDSGGPLVGYASPALGSGPVETIYGITSFGDPGCDSALFDSVAQSVGPHYSWISSFLPAPPSAGNGDEMFFYREDGLYRFYNVRADGSLSKPMKAGDNYTRGWSSITGIDLDGDGQDEMFFYREDGLYRFYNVRSDGSIGSPLRAGDEYTRGWDSITAVDLDGDGQDEMFFYREDGLYRYYDIRPNGSLPKPIVGGDNYTRAWSSITAIDLEGDGQDEMFFYRRDGLFRYYDVRPDGSLPKPLSAGDSYTRDWTAITSVELGG